MAEQALSDVKVLDLSWHIAGPYCTKLLASYGANVIKVERPGIGDPARKMGPFFKDDPHLEKSGLFLYLNTNKKSITLNLKSSGGVKIFKELVREADVLVENFEPRVMPSLGLSYETLKEINPGLVMTSISNFGQTGPYRDFKGTNLTMTALGGALAITGGEHGLSVLGGSQAEYMGGLMGFSATLIALIWRADSGVGQRVDLSIMECVSGNLEGATTEYPYLGLVRSLAILQMLPRDMARYYAAFVYGHPVGIYPCKNGYVMVTPGLGAMPSLALLLGHPEYEEHELFKDRRARQMRAKEFDELFMYPYLKEHDKEEIEESAQELRMPFAAIQDTSEAIRDGQLKAREFFTEIEHPATGRLTYPGAPFKMSETPWQAGRAPLLGEHNEEVYCQRLGYTKEDLVKLRQADII